MVMYGDRETVPSSFLDVSRRLPRTARYACLLNRDHTTLHYTTCLIAPIFIDCCPSFAFESVSSHSLSTVSLSLSLFSVVCNPLVYFVLSFFLLPLVTNKQQHCVVSLLPGHSYSTCIWPIYTTPCTATHSLLRHTLHAEEHHPGLFSC